MEKHHEKHLEKYGWVENKARDADILMIEAADPNGTKGAVQTWKYTVRNQLMYVPDGVDATYPKSDEPKGPPKQILYDNTRITTKFPEKIQKKEETPVIWSMMATSDRQLLDLRKAEREGGKIDLDNLLGPHKPNVLESPKVGGYGFVATPSPAPGIDMSPITTWGRIDSTPLLLDPMATPLDLSNGPAFKVPEPPAREKIAMKLAEKASLKMRQKTLSSNRHTPLQSPSPSISSPFSPAGRSLIRSLSSRTQSVGPDLQLRASYKSPLVSKNIIRTPTFTPSPAKTTPIATPVDKQSISTPTSQRSITDDLLNIPILVKEKKSETNKSLTDDLLV